MRVPQADPGGRHGETGNDGRVNRTLAHLLAGLSCQIHHGRSATALEERRRKYGDGPVHQESPDLTQSWSPSETYGCVESVLCHALRDGFSRSSQSAGRCRRSDRQKRSKADRGVPDGDPGGNTPATLPVSAGKNGARNLDGISLPDGPAPARDSG